MLADMNFYKEILFLFMTNFLNSFFVIFKEVNFENKLKKSTRTFQ